MINASGPRLHFQLPAITFARTIVNTGFRMIYPFLPVIARGLGVSLETVVIAVTFRSLLGLASPLLGSLADFQGRKNSMLIGLLMFAIGFMLIALWPSLTTLFLSLALSVIGKIILDPAVQAYLGDRVTYERRGTAIAITEFGWSGAALLGIPLVGWIISRGGWTAPFPWLAIMSLVAAAWLYRMISPDDPSDLQNSSPISSLRTVIQHSPARVGALVGLLFSLGNEAIMIIYGAWLEQSFMLEVAALGAATAVIGIAELSGEGLVAGFSDRIGKVQAVTLGILVNTAATAILALMGKNLIGALIGLFLIFITFEFSIVSMISLMTELVPGARATTMAGYVAGIAAGRSLGALLGSQLFSFGIWANCAAAAALNLVAAALLRQYLQD